MITASSPHHRHHPLIEDLFKEQAERRPDALAVVDGGIRLTYRELHERAGRLAAGLVARGVGRETPVAMAFPRSADAIVCTLAIVLAGGAYLPVNPEFPGERLAHMLGDSGASLLVCAPGLEEALAPALPAGTCLVTPDALVAEGARAAAGSPAGPAPAPAPGPAAAAGAEEWRSPLAYVMFTSGSTGRPKGVLVEQAGIVRLVKDNGFFRFSERERLLLTGALEFDAATFEIWGCLLNGATLYVTDKETLLVPSALKKVLHDNAITVMWMTAPLFSQTVDADPDVFARLGAVVVGGDVLSARHVRTLRAAHPALRVINGYGPTENTTFTTTHEVRPDEPGAIPIGRPLAGTTVLVLDEQREPVPVGEPGELYTGGSGLARGYLGNPQLTEERFVTIDGERYYRTGDRVSLDAEGLVHFHGRIDDQVKIRGHRVEVKEVEAVLMACPGVLDACVVVASDEAGKHLLGYAVLADGVRAHDVDAALAERLPDYLRPERLVVLERLPLNANGKVDKAALPAPGPAGPASADAPDRDHLPAGQRELAGLWDAVLRLKGRGLGPDDDFFALGGNSLAVGALIGRLAVRDGVQLSFSEVFEHRTLAAMADAVRRAAQAAPARSLPHVTPVPAGVPSALHPQQHGLHTHAQVAAASVAYNIPLRLDVHGPLSATAVRGALAELVRRHDALRTRFVTTPEGVRQQPAPGATVQLTTSDALAHGDDRAVLETFVRPFDLERAPLLRALLVRVDDTHHRLYLDVHHIVFDGVSLRIVAEELTELLSGTPLPETKWGYADASQWFADRLADGSFEADERYWLTTLADPPRLELPTDHPRPAVRAETGAVLRLALTPERNAAVGRIADREGTTPFTVLLSAYSAALMQLSGQHDVVVGSPMSGRVHPDLEPVVGMFVNTAALRLTVAEPATLADLLAVTHRGHQEALEHQACPFERVVGRLGLPRDTSRLPLLDAFFALQNIDFHTFARDGLRVDVHLLHAGSCRFDLNLQAYQRPDGTVLELEYSTALFAASSAEYLLHRVAELIDDLDASPHTPLFGPSASQDAVTPAYADFSF
ncbi:amino acid adenylation domain-containing protein [Streptomyces sp. SCA3-4]|uniref:non-ribosomal peptide synthetase n=1 Tax=Streptomyces sichuanensis TaxID=2871810 RepID=UPI001CE25A13|nr:non-ribosomal peptide synthetase [Streptomyces sichuanensis]MCA6092028.1 amino acid adenylation domain-containing protein [Streptomyces sichuanensis]